MNILQISDIHLGGEYNGRFDCLLNFAAVLNYATKRSAYIIHKIVVTGDLADVNYAENYRIIREMLDKTGIPYMVIPGNHDDAAEMRIQFGVHAVPECGYCEQNGIAYWDNTDVDATEVPKFTSSKTLFCHYPVADVSHAFMSKYVLKHAVKLGVDLKKLGIENVFCGHVHFDCAGCSTGPEGNRLPVVHVAPATQCQIDPNCSTFKAISARSYSGMPGYVIVNVSDLRGTVNEFESFRVDPLYPVENLEDYQARLSELRVGIKQQLYHIIGDVESVWIASGNSLENASGNGTDLRNSANTLIRAVDSLLSADTESTISKFRKHLAEVEAEDAKK